MQQPDFSTILMIVCWVFMMPMLCNNLYKQYQARRRARIAEDIRLQEILEAGQRAREENQTLAGMIATASDTPTVIEGGMINAARIVVGSIRADQIMPGGGLYGNPRLPGSDMYQPSWETREVRLLRYSADPTVRVAANSFDIQDHPGHRVYCVSDDRLYQVDALGIGHVIIYSQDYMQPSASTYVETQAEIPSRLPEPDIRFVGRRRVRNKTPTPLVRNPLPYRKTRVPDLCQSNVESRASYRILRPSLKRVLTAQKSLPCCASKTTAWMTSSGSGNSIDAGYPPSSVTISESIKSSPVE